MGGTGFGATAASPASLTRQRVGTLLRRLTLTMAAGLALVVFWLGFVWPPPSWWRSHWPAETAFMRMRSRQLAATGDTTQRRYRPVPLDSMTRWLPQAATAGEDGAFFQHHGVDWRALRDALGYRPGTFAWSNPRDVRELRRAVARAYERRERLRGASTITQQLAKNLYLSASRNPLRKLKEALIAYRLEWVLSKERILTLYLNVAEFGRNLWGVEAASERYFGTSAARLTLDEAALLIAALPHPLTSNPGYRPGRTRWRAQLIARRLRGEALVVPPEAGEDTLVPPPPVAPLAPESLAAATDSLRWLDSLLRPEGPRPPDTSKTPKSREPVPNKEPAAAPRRDTAAMRARPLP